MSPVNSGLISPSRDRAGNDPIFLWNGEARSRMAAGEDILNATIGALIDDGGLLCTFPTVLETLRKYQTREQAGYAPISGLPAYRDAVVHDVFSGSGLDDKAVSVATAGGSGAVYAVVVNFLERGQKMLVPEFFWGPYREITNHSDRGLDTFTMFDGAGDFNLDAMNRGLESHLDQQGRALLVLNFPCHNPTGYTLTPSEWASVTEVVTRAADRGPITVLIDAAYMEYAGDQSRDWLAAVPALMERCTVLVAWTASKSMAQYGARVGAVLALHDDASERTQLDNALGYTARATWSNCNHLGQRAVTELLTDPGLAGAVRSERGEVLELLRSRIRRFNQLAGAAALPAPRYDDGFFVTVFGDGHKVGAKLRERGVYTVPLDGGVRIALCSTPERQIERLVEALEYGLATTA